MKDFEPSQEDIVGSEFNPPYRFIFGKHDWTEKEKNALEEFKKQEYFLALDRNYWNDSQIMRYYCLISDLSKEVISN